MATTIDNNGNAVYNGYSTNLPQGSVQANQAISSGSMAPVAPVNVPPPTNVNPSTYLGATAGVATDLATGVNNLKEQQAVKDNQSNVDNTTARLLGLSGDVANTQANNVKDYGTTYQNTGVNDLYNQLQDLNAQATGLANEAKAIPIQTQQQAQGTAGTQSGVESTNRDLLASNALKALSLGQQYAIASGNYNKAKLSPVKSYLRRLPFRTTFSEPYLNNTSHPKLSSIVEGTNSLTLFSAVCLGVMVICTNTN